MKAGKRAKRCVYCGAVTDRKACPSHRDLLEIEHSAAVGDLAVTGSARRRNSDKREAASDTVRAVSRSWRRVSRAAAVITSGAMQAAPAGEDVQADE